MRPYFTDYARLKRQAKKAVSGGSSYIRRWWSQKYKRPANDPLFEERSMSEWVREMYEDFYERKAEIVSQLEDDMTPMSEKSSLIARLEGINKALGEDLDYSADPLADKWERELKDGIEPDLDEMPEQTSG